MMSTDKKNLYIKKSETVIATLHAESGITAVVALPGVYNHGKL